MADIPGGATRRKSGAATEARLIAISTQLFTDLGFERVTTRMIAEACEITVPTIYLYFKDKRALYLRCCVDVFTRSAERLQAVMTADVPADQRVYGGLLELARLQIDDPHLSKLFQRELADSDVEGLRILNAASLAGPLALMHGNILEALGREPPPLTAMSMFALTSGLIQYRQVTDEVSAALDSGKGAPAERLARHVLRIVTPDIHRRLFGS